MKPVLRNAVPCARNLLRRLLSRDKPRDGLRIFIDHAGWSPDQLEHEVDDGAWTLARADADAVLNGTVEVPWPLSPDPVPKLST